MVLRPGIADPEGLTVASGLKSLGYDRVTDVRSGKLLVVRFDAADGDAAEATVAEMCRRLLANPVMEDASWEIAEEPAAVPVEA